MGKLFKIAALFLYLFLMYVVSSLIFTKGFLLKRDVIQRGSSCRVDFAQYSDGEAHGGEGCWLHRRFDKAIFIVIDALRFDFLVRRNETTPFHNKLSVVYDLLEKKPKNSRAYKFLADPPTTTVQRLKGLTTGSLPTFVDVGTNFGSSEINEDNFIDQAVKRNKKITFLGDETWTDLYPNRFNRAYPVPSFNLKDLHVVDNAVLSHIYDEMKKPDWDILIAHFLGVDHCGHTYGPNSRAMEDKLLRMNEMLRNVTSRMDENTVLFLLGDHGMTSSGDHGGDSQDEVEAGLFVYSPTQITASLYVQDEYKTINQVDLVPTVSLLLGLPVPFSNLGTIITDLFNHCDWSKDSHIKEVYHTIEALRLNAKQISLYIDAYTKTSTDLNRAKLKMLQQYLANTEQKLQNLVTELFINNFAENTHQQLHDIEAEYRNFIKQVREMCQEVWAKFDLTSMTLGVLMLVVTILVNIYILLFECKVTEDKGSGTLVIVLVVSSVFIVFSVIQAVFLEGKAVHILSFILGVFDLIVVLIIMIVVYSNSSQRTMTTKKNKKSSIISQYLTNSFTLEHAFCILCMTISIGSFFTNSFVVNEDSVTMFLTEIMIWIFGVKCVQGILRDGKTGKDSQKLKSRTTKHFDLMKFLTQPVAIVIILTFMCNFCLRLSKNFRSCREEQTMEGNCTNSVFMYPLSSIGQTVEGNKNVRYFFSVTCMVLFSYLCRKWMTNYGNLNGGSLSVICGRYIIPAACGATVFHWAVQGLPEKLMSSLPVWQQVLLAQTVYLFVCLSVVAFIFKPLFIFVLPRQQDKVPLHTTGESSDLIKKVFNHLKTSLSDSSAMQHNGSGSETPVVFGLGTVYSASFVFLGAAIYMLISLLLGDGIAPSLLSGAVALVLFLELFAIAVRTCKESDLLLPGVVTLSLITTNYFYATGHQATIPSIRFDAAFIGFHGNWNNHIIPAMLICLNMFAAEVMLTFVSPLLILWPCTKGIFSGLVFPKKADSDRLWRGDYVMFENMETFCSLLMKQTAVFYLINGLKILASMLSAGILRRHLMVWKIFAPRFVYQAVSSFVVFGTCVLSLFVIMRVNRALTKWTAKLNNRYR